MQSLSSLRSALRSFSSPSPLPTHGGFGSISRYCASPGGFVSSNIFAKGESAKHMLQYSGNLGMNLSLLAAKDHVSAPYALSFQSSIHSAGQKNFEMGSNSNTKPTDFSAAPKDFEMGRNSKPMDFSAGQRDFEMGNNSRPMNFSAVRRDFVMGSNSRPMDFSAGRRDLEMGSNSRPTDFSAGCRDFEMGSNSRPMDFPAGREDFEMRRNSRPMDFVRGIIEQEGSRRTVEKDADFVLIKLMRNNTFVSVMDSKGNKKTGMTTGWLQKKQGGAKLSQYSAEATAEHVGRAAREKGLKSFVMRVNGFTYFKKKRQAIMSFREGFSQSRTGESPIVYIEDTTRRPHNGCRLPKKRRI